MNDSTALLPREQQSPAQQIQAVLAAGPTTPETLRQLLELQKDWELWNAQREFIAAMNRLQPRLPRIVKRGSIDLGKGKPLAFARYEDIDEAIRPLLQAEGFSISFGATPANGGLLITATLSHAAGHSRTESMPLPFDQGPGRNAVQAVGSALSYGKRYLVCAMLNIVTVSEDDDARSIGLINNDQTLRLVGLIETSKADYDKFLTWASERAGAKVKSAADLPRRLYEEAVTLLMNKARKAAPSLREFEEFPDPHEFKSGEVIMVQGTRYSPNADGTAWKEVMWK